LIKAAASFAEAYLAVDPQSSLEIDVRIVHPEDTWNCMEDIRQVFGTKYRRYREKPAIRQLFMDEEKMNCSSAAPCERCARLAVC
jgi:hypothetical protein